MFGLKRLWAAVARLAGAVEALAETAEESNRRARLELGLDGPPDPPPAAQAAVRLSVAAVEDQDFEPVASGQDNGRARKRK